MGDPLFLRTYPLDSGPRVHLRLARPSDRAAVVALLNDRGVEFDALAVRRLLAGDPALRRVMAAFAPIDGVETLVGIGAIDLTEHADVDTLVIDDRQTAGLGQLLGRVLRGRAAAHAHRVA